MPKWNHYYFICYGIILISIGILLVLTLFNPFSSTISFLLFILSICLNIPLIIGIVFIVIGLIIRYNSKHKIQKSNKQLSSSIKSLNLSSTERDLYGYLKDNYGKPFSSQILFEKKDEILNENKRITKLNFMKCLEKIYGVGLIKRSIDNEDLFYYFIN
jgi:hypothetical protein